MNTFANTIELTDYCNRLCERLTLRHPTHDCTAATLQSLLTHHGKDKLTAKIKHMLEMTNFNLLDSFEDTLRFLMQTDGSIEAIKAKDATGEVLRFQTDVDCEKYLQSLSDASRASLIGKLLKRQERFALLLPRQLLEQGLKGLRESKPNRYSYVILRKHKE